MLTSRREDVLRIIVREYVTTAMPIASESIARIYPSKISSATIRNEMAILEEEGYIIQPHHSAGRIPSDKGYLHYIESLTNDSELPLAEQHQIRHQFHQAKNDLDEWGRLAASVLSQTVRNVAIVTLPKPIQSHFKHLEIISIQSLVALLIIVVEEAKIKQSLLPLAEEMTQDELSAISRKLNAAFAGQTCHQIANTHIQFSSIEEQVTNAIIEFMLDEDEQEYQDLFIDGIRHILDQPEFMKPDQMRNIIEVFEERTFLRNFLPQALIGNGIGVVVGKGNTVNAMRQCSMIMSKYGIPGHISGALGVVGPTRMQYERTISAVRCLATIMTDLLSSLYGYQSDRG